MKTIMTDEYEALKRASAELDRLHALINTPELVDFPKAVLLESVHQLERWGVEDRTSKSPSQWFWLLGELSGRSLHHHKEAERLAAVIADHPERADDLRPLIAHHREKATHHTITSAAVLSHWHASIVGHHTGLNPTYQPAAKLAAETYGPI